jgi:hypothetical protein
MRILRWLVLVFTAANCLGQAQPVDRNLVRMTVPNSPGRLEFSSGPVSVQQSLRPDGKEMRVAQQSKKTGLMLTAFLQHVDFHPSAAECRKRWFDPSKEPPTAPRKTHIRMSESGDMARIDYDVPEFQGQPVAQHSVHAYLGGGEVCAEIHMSKVLYRPADEAIFEAVLRTVKLDARAPAMPNALEYFQKGSGFFLEKNWKMAASQYQRALDIEKESRTLPEPYFKALVDNLGMAYGIDQQLAKAKFVAEVKGMQAAR